MIFLFVMCKFLYLQVCVCEMKSTVNMLMFAANRHSLTCLWDLLHNPIIDSEYMFLNINKIIYLIFDVS